MTMPDSTPNNHDSERPSLHVDADWKAQAQAEKERLSKKEEEKAKSPRRGPDDLPPADFRGLMGILASQAVMSLGGYSDPQSGRPVVDMTGAQFAIDLLAVLEEKTAGNLSEEEANELKMVLSELRNRFVQFGALIAKQQAGGGAAAAGIDAGGTSVGGGEPAPGTSAKPKIHIP